MKNKSQTNKISTLFLVSLILGVVLVMAINYEVNGIPSFEPTSPANGSTVPNHFTLLNVTVNITGNLDVKIFANSNKSRLNLSESLVFHTLNATQNISYNLTTIPIQSDDDGLVALYHFDNLSEFGENSTQVFDFAGLKGLNNATIFNSPNVSWNESGKMGGGYDFNGIDLAGAGYIKSDNAVSLSDSSDFTISIWAKLNQHHTGDSPDLATTQFFIGNDSDQKANTMYLRNSGNNLTSFVLRDA